MLKEPAGKSIVCPLLAARNRFDSVNINVSGNSIQQAKHRCFDNGSTFVSGLKLVNRVFNVEIDDVFGHIKNVGDLLSRLSIGSPLQDFHLSVRQSNVLRLRGFFNEESGQGQVSNIDQPVHLVFFGPKLFRGEQIM